ncbi:MAG: TetR/AcrR family transcriptional regulator [Oleispira antarctica]|uniref:Regulatory protein, TetR family n=1 Tax=Oleispira antarctica RB-8 TaxID=698738 RepID=R4YPZ8_OLEAN|nr:TetR/AcrR family transcriptional regulator [Oleispira antarctica]MBQ0792448.1 TetR/AcrR family transcriptional regulator [Oleispira antarctica]CCK74229.1 Regulatory protein, TetR family [Oleispira antarctica RB-8]
MKTRDRILAAALELFNQQGERKVTTNHISAHLGMSPGNLYYHFKNKQEIIYELFLSYEEMVDANLKVPTERQLTVEDKLHYLQKVFQGLWEYRFIHRDMEHLLLGEDRLHSRYRDFFRRCQKNTEGIYKGLRDANIIKLDDRNLEGLALNTWIVVTSWFSFLQCNLLADKNESITLDMVKGGIYQVFQLEHPYLSDEYREQVELMQAAFIPKPDWL